MERKIFGITVCFILPIIPIQDGETPLYTASRTGRFDVVKVLLEHKANPNVGSKVSCSLIVHVKETLLANIFACKQSFYFNSAYSLKY